MYTVVPNFKARTQESNYTFFGRPELNLSSGLCIAKGLPKGVETTRLGRSFYAQQATATAPVTAVPTTTARFALWNGEPDGGRFYAIDSVFAICVAAGASNTLSLVGQLNIGRKANPGATSVTIRGVNGGKYRGFASARVTLTVTNDSAWQALGNSAVVPANVTAMTVNFPINGKIIVPPGGIFGISSLMQDSASSTTRIGIMWHEILLPIGNSGG